MVLPSNGAGITIAMIGGRIAGQTIVSHLENETSLHEYELEWKRTDGFSNAEFKIILQDWKLDNEASRLDSQSCF